jgi:hypothetical protein
VIFLEPNGLKKTNIPVIKMVFRNLLKKYDFQVFKHQFGFQDFFPISNWVGTLSVQHEFSALTLSFVDFSEHNNMVW